MTRLLAVASVAFVALAALSGCGSATSDSTSSVQAKRQRYADAITAVLARDKQLSDWAVTEIEKGANAPAVLQLCVDEMRKIDLTGCPAEFQQAYLKHVYAWSEVPPLMRKYEGVRGFFTALLEGAAGTYDGDAEAKRIQKGIRDTLLEVETIALRYGVQQKR
jgi:uncharacterized protein YceK